VNVYPVIDDRINVEIKGSDVRVDMRASGAGSQHVNNTESAIRLTRPEQHRGLLRNDRCGIAIARRLGRCCARLYERR
jgi:protein subunit release factor B